MWILTNEREAMPKLYEISNELAAIIGNDDGELSDDVATRLTELELALEVKIENVLQFRQGILADAEAFKAERERLKAREDALTRRAEWMKNYVYNALQQLGIGKVSTTTFTATVAKSPPRVELDDGIPIPDQYARTKTTVDLDKTAVLADHKSGKALPPGITVKQGTYLKIS